MSTEILLPSMIITVCIQQFIHTHSNFPPPILRVAVIDVRLVKAVRVKAINVWLVVTVRAAVIDIRSLVKVVVKIGVIDLFGGGGGKSNDD